MENKCPKCDWEVKSTNKFCMNCGQALSSLHEETDHSERKNKKLATKKVISYLGTSLL